MLLSEMLGIDCVQRPTWGQRPIVGIDGARVDQTGVQRRQLWGILLIAFLLGFFLHYLGTNSVEEPSLPRFLCNGRHPPGDSSRDNSGLDAVI